MVSLKDFQDVIYGGIKICCHNRSLVTKEHGLFWYEPKYFCVHLKVTFYISQTEADNHAVREAACACIAELGSKVSIVDCSFQKRVTFGTVMNS